MRIWFMKNKVIKTIIKIYFLIENAEHSGCLNHTLHPLLCQISLRGKDSNCVLDIHPVYPLEHRELEGCAQQVPRDRSPMPAPSISRCPLLTPLFKLSVHGRFKLLLETFFSKDLIPKSLAVCWLSSHHICLLGQSNTEVWNLQLVAKRIQKGS